jgi:hypothetical protein
VEHRADGKCRMASQPADEPVLPAACRGECDCIQHNEESPHVTIDSRGREVAVVVSYSHYISLLGILATQFDSCVLPPYWRAAVERCLIPALSVTAPVAGRPPRAAGGHTG